METKRCPYCGHEIMSAAKKCKHCGEWLEDKPQNNESEEKESNDNDVSIDYSLSKKISFVVIGIFALIFIFSLMQCGN